MPARKPPKTNTAFKPTDEQRELVEDLAACGTPLKEICGVIVDPQTGRAISVETLTKCFAAEIASGVPRANFAVAEFLWQKATGQLGHDNAAVAAAMFWLKCRAGWKTNRDDAVADDVTLAPSEEIPGMAEPTSKYVGKKAQAQIAAEGSTGARLELVEIAELNVGMGFFCKRLGRSA